MRMRKKKHAQSRLAACAGRVIAGAPEYSPEDRVFLEIGAGKGGFACETARRNPAVRYFAMERVTDCVVLAAERAEETQKESGGLEGLRFLIGTADDLALLFAPASVERIYLNFSDPWSKKGYAKRRLTHRRYLALYLALLRDGGRLAFKTDNVDLFDFTLGELAAIGWEPSFVTRDLHASPAAADNVMTEYETAFVAQNPEQGH